MLMRLYSLFPSFNKILKYITGNHMLTLSYILYGLIYSTFVPYLYGLIRRILYPFFSEHNVTRPCRWSNTSLSQMAPYMAFYICMQRGYLAWLYFRLYSRGQLGLYFCGYYIYYFASDFADVLITNPPFVLSGESHQGQIIIVLYYNLHPFCCQYNWKCCCSLNDRPWVIFVNIGLGNVTSPH